MGATGFLGTRGWDDLVRRAVDPVHERPKSRVCRVRQPAIPLRGHRPQLPWQRSSGATALVFLTFAAARGAGRIEIDRELLGPTVDLLSILSKVSRDPRDVAIEPLHNAPEPLRIRDLVRRDESPERR